MELGTNFVSRLEPFLLMAKSAKGAAAAKLIQDVTSAPGVFVFTELLELPNIQEVCSIFSAFTK
jgi:COP9 signalosome complex subunit 7